MNYPSVRFVLMCFVFILLAEGNQNDSSEEHRCKNKCHLGDCGPCDGLAKVRCRCGKNVKVISAPNKYLEFMIIYQCCAVKYNFLQINKFKCLCTSIFNNISSGLFHVPFIVNVLWFESLNVKILRWLQCTTVFIQDLVECDSAGIVTECYVSLEFYKDLVAVLYVHYKLVTRMLTSSGQVLLPLDLTGSALHVAKR